MKQPEQTHYYLIGGEIKKGERKTFIGGYTVKYGISIAEFDLANNNWLNSLQPCSITHRELGELIKYVLENNANIDLYNPIEVTDIIEKDCKSECHLSLSKKCICPDYRFKQPKSEANEAVNKRLLTFLETLHFHGYLDCDITKIKDLTQYY